MAKIKEKYVKKKGLLGDAEDYNVYEMNAKERSRAFLVGFLAGVIGAQIMFEFLPASLVFGVVTGFVAQPVARGMLFDKRKRQMLLQFRDLMDAMSNSFTAGRTIGGAINDAATDMEMAHGADAIITKEVQTLQTGMQFNFTIEDLLEDMADRCGLQDIRMFSDTFTTCNRMGGDLKRIVSDTRDIINNKIDIEMEIQTMVSGNKNTLYIMSVMPFVIILALHMMGGAASAVNATSVVVRIFSALLFAASFVVGMKLIDIKV